MKPPYGGNDAKPVFELTVLGFEDALKNAKVVVVAKKSCGFCKKANDILSGATSNMAVFDVDEVEGAAIRQKAQDETGHKTVPIVYINGEYVGGCSDVVELQRSGDLYTRLDTSRPTNMALVSPDGTRKPPMSSGLFWFPHTVNIYPVRGIAFQMAVLSIICIIWRKESWAAWVALGMALDFFVRFLGGAFFSPAGSLAMVLTAPLKEDMRNGPPKQFATFVGLCFSLSAGMCLEQDEDIAGAVILGCLAGAASLEAFLDFCLGCWFFGLFVDFGLVNSNVYEVHIEQKPLVEAAIKFADDFEAELKEIDAIHYRDVDQPSTSADPKLKVNKSDDHVRRGFNPVKYVQLGDYMMPLGVGGLAFVWKLGIQNYKSDPLVFTYYGPSELWWTIAYVSLALFSLITLLLIGKLFLHPRKVLKEMVHPVKSNVVAALPMCLCLYAHLYDTDVKTGPDWNFKQVLFMTGAILLKLLLVWKIAHLIGNRADEEIITPMLLLPIGGCLLAALVAPSFGSGYYEFGWFLFGLSSLLSILLFGGTFVESIKYHWSDERIRPSIGLWATLLQLIFLAYDALRTSGAPAISSFIPGKTALADPFERVLFYSGLTLTLVFLWLAVPMGFAFRLKFDFSFWSVAFVADILALSCQLFHKRTEVGSVGLDENDKFDRFIGYMEYATIVLATWVNVVLFLQTLFWLIKRRWLRPSYKWGPLSFNKLTHEALRAAGDDLMRSARSLKEKLPAGDTHPNNEGDETSPEATIQQVKGFAKQLELFLLVLDWHSHMEDNVLFRWVDSFHPLVSRDGYLQHQAIHKLEAVLSKKCNELLSGSSDYRTLVAEISAILDDFIPYSSKHMDWEEDNLNGLNRKTFNLAIQKKVLVNLWEVYNSKSMEEVRVKPVARESAGEWQAYDFSNFGTGDFSNGFPNDAANKEELLRFPPKVPEGPMPPAKQHILRVVLPYVTAWLPYPMQKTRFARSLCWALPEHAQHIGDMIYRGVSDVTWACLVADVPEIIPRGLPGWIRRV